MSEFSQNNNFIKVNEIKTLFPQNDLNKLNKNQSQFLIYRKNLIVNSQNLKSDKINTSSNQKLIQSNSDNTNYIQNNLANSIQINFFDCFWILISAILAGLLLRHVFRKYAITYSSKMDFGNSILIIVISIAGLIAVVKSSLALSLGLVGALSVVRFRTAVKEPYNLAFILLSISVAIAIGASQFLFAFSIVVIGSLAAIYLYKDSGKSIIQERSNIVGMDTLIASLPPETNLDNFYSLIRKNTDYFSIVSLEQNKKGEFSISIKTSFKDLNDLNKLIEVISNKHPNASFTFYNSPNS